MGALKLHLRFSQSVDGVAVDPETDWSFDALVSELDASEIKLAASSIKLWPLDKTISNFKDRPFIMGAYEYEMEDIKSEDDDDHDRALVVAGKRFTCDELYLSDSDDSDVASGFEMQPYLMDEVGDIEGSLFEFTHEHLVRVKDGIRNKISALEMALVNESQNSTSALLRVEKYKETRREFDKKFDTQYQRRIAEALDNHLTAVQRDRELKSQIEERKIRSDAAFEEAKRKAALQEEKQQQEKAKAEAEAKLRAEEAKQAALEAKRRAEVEAEKRAAVEVERRAEKEAIERNVTENSKSVNSGGIQQEAARFSADTASSLLNVETKESGNVYRAAASASNLEHGRLQKLKELYERNQVIRSSSNMDYTRHESHISRLIRQISGTRDNVRSKASDLIKLLNDPQCPQSIGVEIFAKKVVSWCEIRRDTAFASAYVIVLVTSQVPQAMDVLLAEFHRACPYTVPKHMVYRKSTIQSKEAYFRSIGYQKDDGKMESTKHYLEWLESYTMVYGALIQTEIPNVQNLHGMQEGWARLARFSSALPANQYTAVSVNAFLQMAGFALFRRYKSQFLKMLKVISENFLVQLKSLQVQELTKTVAEIQTYIEDENFLQEPEGKSLLSSLLSNASVHY